ncbi:MAG TPA: hypothetical protein VNE39_05695 [Planctomycetota bacterium]|nr:hypothetical protein [Planctomycetota bacterium]
MQPEKLPESGEVSSEAPPPKVRPHFLATDALVLATCTALAYIFAFAYEAGYCSFYGIPASFVTIDLTVMLMVAGALVALLVALFGVANGLYMAFARRSLWIRNAMFKVGIFFTLFVGYLVTYKGHWKGWLPWFLAATIIALVEFAVPILTQRGKATYAEKLEAAAEAEATPGGPPTLFDRLRRHIGQSALNVIVAGILTLNLCRGAGEASAMQQENFLVVNTSPETVVLRVYGGTLICAEFDRAEKRVKKHFILLQAASQLERTFQLESVGPFARESP